MHLIYERVTTIDEAVFDECFTACKTEFIYNMPWITIRNVNASTVTEAFARDWALSSFKAAAAKNSDTRGFVFLIKNAETGRVLAMYIAQKSSAPDMPNTLVFLATLVNTDENGSIMGWLIKSFEAEKQTHGVKEGLLNSIGCTRWCQYAYTQRALDIVSNYFVNDGPLWPLSGRHRSRIYSPYGW